MVSRGQDSKKWLVVGGAVVLLLAGLFMGGPYLAASSWRSDTLEKTNMVIDKVNGTNKDISTYSTKLQPTAEDYTKLAAAYDSQMKAVEAAKKDLTEVGGIPGIDVTGAYAKAQNTRKELVAAYDELLALDKAGVAKAKAEQEVSGMFDNAAAPQNESEAKALVAKIKDAAGKVTEFANSSNGTDYDKKVANVFTKLATAMETMYNAATEAEATAAQETVNKIVEEMSGLQTEGEAAQKAFQKKIDDNVDRLNKAVKTLE